MERKKQNVGAEELTQEKMIMCWKKAVILALEYVWVWAVYSIICWKEFISNKMLTKKTRCLMMWYMLARGASFYLGSDRVCKAMSECDREEVLHPDSAYCILNYMISQWIFIYEKGTRAYRDNTVVENL